MPSKSKSQKQLMAACCRNPKAMKNCPPKKVACEYHRKDKKPQTRGLVKP